MFIHNATFMIEKEREQEFLKWLVARVDRLVTPPALNPRLSTMREAGGLDYQQAEAQSVAFQLEFPDFGTASLWRADRFEPVAKEFAEHFGPNAMTFCSIFEQIDF